MTNFLDPFNVFFVKDIIEVGIAYNPEPSIFVRIFAIRVIGYGIYNAIFGVIIVHNKDRCGGSYYDHYNCNYCNQQTFLHNISWMIHPTYRAYNTHINAL